MKNALIGVFALAVVGLLFYMAFFKPTATFGSTAGATFNTSKVMSQAVTTATTTTFAVYNGDASNRVIRSADVYLHGGTSTSTPYTINCATSTSASSLHSNTNYILTATILGNSNSFYGTTTGQGLYFASTSPGITGAPGTPTTAVATTTLATVARVVPAGTYVACQVTTGDGYNAFNSGVSGTISFPYDPQ